jgi:hypothetical protein
MAKDDPRTRAFLDDLIAVYRKHGMSLGHEDHQGAFLVEDLAERNVDWLVDAFDKRESAHG